MRLRRAADRSAGGAAGAGGAVLAGLGVGLLAEHRLVRRRVRPDSPTEALPTLDSTREASVSCPGDGAVVLAVREAGPASAALTVVFVHGYTVTSACWATQVRDLRAPGGSGARLVLYDQRGHGASTPGLSQDNTIEQLGRDLAEVLRQRVPEGPVVLVGHSMGGMTIMALAEQRPELFGDRIVAEALPDAELVVVAGSGHMVMMEAPGAVSDQLRRLIARTS